MTDLEKNFIHLKNEISLTREERAFMRSYLETLSNAKPVHVQAPVPSPYAYFSFFMQPVRMVALLLIIAVTGSATTVAASGSALPGEALYSLKVNVNEPLQGVLAFSPNEKADVEIRHAEERLKEIQLLSAEGKNDRIPDAALKAEQRIALARTHILTLVGQSEEAKDAESELSSALSAHADILDAQAIMRDDDAGISMSGLARAIRTDDDLLLATAERAQKTVQKAKERIEERKLPQEAYDALKGELSLVMEELARSEDRGSVRGFALAERHAYRVLALADSAERIRAKTGKEIQISFTEDNSGKGNAEAATSVRAKSVTPTATLMTATSNDEEEDEDRSDEEDRDEDEDTVRTLELHISGDDEDRDEDSHSGKDDSKDEDEDEDDEDSSGSNSGSGSGH